jgi:hypothetical protein
MSDVQAPKVAVVVVHGVAYHAPGASAQAAAELLHGLRRNRASSPYRADEEQTVSIPLKQLEVIKPIGETEKDDAKKKKRGRIQQALFDYFHCLQERTVFLTRTWRDTGATKSGGEVGKEKVANDFMKLVLQDYRGVQDPETKPDEHDEAASYVTTCLKLTRDATPVTRGPDSPATASNPPEIDPNLPPTTDVHIYECYWADLSRPDNTVLSFFLGLYQLLFHFASLSRLAISTGVLENPKKFGIWSSLDWLQLWAVRVLTLPIPILNVLLFVSLFGVLPALVTDNGVAKFAAVASAALLGLLLYLIVSFKLPSFRWPLTWALMPIIPALLFGAVACWFATHGEPRNVLAVEGWLFGAALIEISVSSYNEVRNGARQAAWTLYLLALATFIVIVSRSQFPDHPISRETLRMMHFVLGALRFSWLLLLVLAGVGLFAGAIAWRSQKDDGKKARAKAAVRASRFALAMPALAIMIVTLAIWSAVFVRANKSDPDEAAAERDTQCSTLMLSKDSPLTDAWGQLKNSWLTREHCLPEAPGRMSDSQTVQRSGTKSSLAVGLFGDAVVDNPPCALRLVVPNVKEARTYACLKNDSTMPVSPGDYFRGLFVWSATPGAPLIVLTMLAGMFLLILWLMPSILTESDPPRGSNNADSRRLGAWLSRGLDATAVAIFLFWSAAFLFPFVFMMILHIIPEPPFLKLLNTPTAAMLEYLGAVTGSVAILASVAKSGSSVLGIMLDVDNYLRTSPANKTPRARIVERYVSLLRYIADDTNKERRYDRVVILAHSLGSTISGDLLLFLKEQGDPGLKRLGLGPSKDPNEKKVDFRLFTMGNPGRQFLNRFFPYLYEWVREIPDNSVKHLGGLTPSGPATPLSGSPDPDRLGVDCWVNAYRSGDYIGRSLWMNEWYNRTTPSNADPKEDGAYPMPIFVATDATKPARRAEMCIGAGAHQHYWDQSAPDIAEKLDELIVL